MDCCCILASIFQLNVAVGILYTALPKFRFRENLYQNTVDNLNSYNFFSNQKLANELAGRNDTYGEAYRYIRRLVDRIPDEYSKQIKGLENFDAYDSNSPPERFWNLWHYWYSRDVDKWLTWIISIIAPFVLLWLCYLTVCFIPQWGVIGFALGGHIIPVLNVLSGIWMVRKVNRRVNGLLERAMPIYRGENIQAFIANRSDEDDRESGQPWT